MLDVPPGHVESYMQVLMPHPLWSRNIAHCQRFLYLPPMRICALKSCVAMHVR
jgi:hypothetical protein